MKFSEDIRPLSEFRSNVAEIIGQVRDTRRAVILTQHGRSAAVLLDVESYEDLLEEVEILRDVHAAETEIAGGRGISYVRVAESRGIRNAGGQGTQDFGAVNLPSNQV
jgi:prevent-host-death family protein